MASHSKTARPRQVSDFDIDEDFGYDMKCLVPICERSRTPRSQLCPQHKDRVYKTGQLRPEIPIRHRLYNHGQSERTEYQIWAGIKQRCRNPRDRNYKHYGGRGIQMCDRWFDSFLDFFADMGDRPSLKHSIDRIDNDGNYEPSNCHWVTQQQQNNNRRDSHFITFQGKTQTLSQWAKELGTTACNLNTRLNKLGWSEEDTLTVPFRKYTTLEYQGITYRPAALIKKLNLEMCVDTLLRRMKRQGWSLEKAINTPRRWDTHKKQPEATR